MLAMAELISGTFTFLFTDIVGSTRLWEKFPSSMGASLAIHDTQLREIFTRHNGNVFKTVGDAFCVAFPSPQDALKGALEAQRALIDAEWGETGPLTVRMGVHTGSAEQRDGDFFGGTLNRASRIESAAHGGQILVSQITVELLVEVPLPDITFKSLGSFRLRNLDRPEHLYQAMMGGLQESFPPPRSMEVLPNNLPVQTTSFVGREKEMESVLRLITQQRLLTLMGTGGTGKTRLALEAGAQLINNFRDGVWLVELAPISDPNRIVEITAAAVGAREEPDRPLRESLINFLKAKSLIIILDNCEHLLTAAASLAADLLKACPDVKIMATSRHSLGISGETTFIVPPLATFDFRMESLRGPNLAERLSQYDGVRLFIARATAVQENFVVTNENAPAVAEICSRLDGIPLAIELAAARVRLLTVEQIAQRLGDRFRLLRGGSRDGLPHQQTLQALIDWSHDLLSEQERVLFRRLAVFVGGRSLEALEAVCSGDLVDELDILDLLQQLVDKSLVIVERSASENPRYTIIESVWQYSREKLEASGEADAIRNRHLDYFLASAEAGEPEFEGAKQLIWFARFYDDRLNFRFALEWASKSEQIEKALRLFAAIQRPTEVRGNLAAACTYGKALLSHPLALKPTVYRARALEAASRLSWANDAYEDARQYYTEAESLFLTLGQLDNSIFVHSLVGFLDRGERNLPAAELRFRRGLEHSEINGDLRLRAVSLSGLGRNAFDRGEFEIALQLIEESLRIYRTLGDRWITGLILWGLARLAIGLNDLDRAEKALKEWAELTTALGNEWIFAYVLETSAECAAARGNFVQAARFMGGAEELREYLTIQFSPSEQDDHVALVARLEAALSPEEFRQHIEAGRILPTNELVREMP